MAAGNGDHSREDPQVSTAKAGQEVTSGVMQVSMKSPMTTGGTDSITTLLMVLILKTTHGA